MLLVTNEEDTQFHYVEKVKCSKVINKKEVHVIFDTGLSINFDVREALMYYDSKIELLNVLNIIINKYISDSPNCLDISYDEEGRFKLNNWLNIIPSFTSHIMEELLDFKKQKVLGR